MSPDLCFELLALTSIVSFLLAGGLLGLWAATSRWHWFARVMVVVCFLALVQWRPLYELYLTLLTQVTTIGVGVAIYRRQWPAWRFSIAGLLAATAIVAVLVVSLNRTPDELELWFELKAVGFGIIGGLLALLASWFVITDWPWKWRLLVGVGWYFNDTLLASFVMDRKMGQNDFSPHPLVPCRIHS